MIEASTIEELKHKLKGEKKPFIVKAKDDVFNLQVLKQRLCNVLVSPEAHKRKENLKNLDSGLNHVLATLARKNSIAIGIDIENISKLEKKERAVRLSRLRQNLNICRKEKTASAVRGGKETFYLLISLGSSTSQAKEALAQSF